MDGRAAARATTIEILEFSNSAEMNCKQKSLQSYMVQLHILEAVLELFFLACPAANKRHKRQLINRAVPNLAVTTFLVGGSPLHPSFLFSSLHSVGRLEKIGRADEHADLGVDLAVECVSSSGVHIMSNCVGWASFKAASIARACAPEQKKGPQQNPTSSLVFSRLQTTKEVHALFFVQVDKWELVRYLHMLPFSHL